jgi:hypothetical protein
LLSIKQLFVIPWSHIKIFGEVSERLKEPVLKTGASGRNPLEIKSFFAEFPQLAEIISASPPGCRGQILEAWGSGLTQLS